jgi:phospholipid/cholesterol/gamma-HCH transport system substrate-binding protein
LVHGSRAVEPVAHICRHELFTRHADTLASKEPLSAADLFEKGNDLIDTANETIKAVQGKVFGTLDAVTKTANNADDVITGVKQGKGTVGMLLRDETVAAHIREAITNAQQATASLKNASSQADALVTDLESRGVGDKVNQTMLSVRSAAQNLHATSQEVRQIVTQAAAPEPGWPRTPIKPRVAGTGDEVPRLEKSL